MESDSNSVQVSEPTSQIADLGQITSPFKVSYFRICKIGGAVPILQDFVWIEWDTAWKILGTQ